MTWLLLLFAAFCAGEPNAPTIRIAEGHFALRYTTDTLADPFGTPIEETRLFEMRSAIFARMRKFDPKTEITLRPRIYLAGLDSEARFSTIEFDAEVAHDGKEILRRHYCSAVPFAYRREPLRFHAWFDALGDAMFRSLSDFSADADAALQGTPLDSIHAASCPEHFLPDSTLVELHGDSATAPSEAVRSAWRKIRRAPEDFASMDKAHTLDTAHISRLCRFWYRMACQAKDDPTSIVFLFPCGLEQIPSWRTRPIAPRLTCYWRLVYDKASRRFLRIDESSPQK